MSSPKDFYLKDEHGIDGTAAESSERSGVSVDTFVDEYRDDLFALWDDQIEARVGFAGLARDRLHEGEGVALGDHTAFMTQAIQVTAARDKVGVGGLVERAQTSIQVLRNARRKQVAFVMGPAVLRQLMDKQIKTLQDKIEELQQSLKASNDAKRAADVRANFFNISKAFKPIKTKVPALKGTRPAPNLEF